MERKAIARASISTSMETVRLNKFLSESGVCSRREADRQIEAGQVMVNGVIATVGQQVSTADSIVFCGRAVAEKPKPTILLVNKPVGIVCTAEVREKNNIVKFINYPERLYPVGRLDKGSRGLILMTNQGELANQILKARNYHEKEYIVRVDKPVDEAFIKAMSAGIYLKELEVATRPCTVQKRSKFTFSIVLTQGLNRQIRRMCASLGFKVLDLQRVRIMNLHLDGIKEGKYRHINDEELSQLIAHIEG